MNDNNELGMGAVDEKAFYKLLQEAKIQKEHDLLAMKLLGLPIDKISGNYGEGVSAAVIKQKRLRDGLLMHILMRKDLYGDDRNEDVFDYGRGSLFPNTISPIVDCKHRKATVNWEPRFVEEYYDPSTKETYSRPVYEAYSPELFGILQSIFAPEINDQIEPEPKVRTDRNTLSLLFLFKNEALNAEMKEEGRRSSILDYFEADFTGSNRSVSEQYALLGALQLMESDKPSSATLDKLIEETFLKKNFSTFSLRKEIGIIEKNDKYISKDDEYIKNLLNDLKVKNYDELAGLIAKHKKTDSFEAYLDVKNGEGNDALRYPLPKLVRLTTEPKRKKSTFFAKKLFLNRNDDSNKVRDGLGNLLGHSSCILYKLNLPMDEAIQCPEMMSHTWAFGPKDWIEYIAKSPAEKQVKEGSKVRKKSDAIASDKRSTERLYRVYGSNKLPYDDEDRA